MNIDTLTHQAPPLVDARQSSAIASEFIRNNPNLWEARLILHAHGNILIDCDTSKVSVIDQYRVDENFCSRPWKQELPEITRVVREVEIHQSNRNSRLVLRLVCKGLLEKNSSKHYLLSQWYLRLKNSPILLSVGSPDGPEGVISDATKLKEFQDQWHLSCFTKPPMAHEIMMLAGQVSRLEANLLGSRPTFGVVKWKHSMVFVGQELKGNNHD